MEHAQVTCPVCRHILKTTPESLHCFGAFFVEYDDRRIQFCSWGCFCLFFQEPERYYLNYKRETGQIVPRMEEILRSVMHVASEQGHGLRGSSVWRGRLGTPK